MVQAPGVTGLAERRALGDRPLPQLRGRRLAYDHRAGGLDPPHHLGVLLLEVEAPGTAELRGLAGQVGVVLDGHGQPQQRRALALGQPAIGLPRFLQRRLPPQAPERVQRRL